MKITWTLLLVAGLTNWGALRGEESTPPRDPTADARLTISDWEKAADDVKETMNPSNDTGPSPCSNVSSGIWIPIKTAV